MRFQHLLLVPALLLATGCVSRLPNESPPLADMIEPLELFAEPDDEAARQQLPLGSFTGCQVGAAEASLEALLDPVDGLQIVEVIENSPADAAGLKVGDLLLEARIGDEPPRALRQDSDWRKLELDAPPGAQIQLSIDRANRRTQTTLTAVPRVRMTKRGAVRRVREEKRVGVVLRSATEVEARAAGLGPGGGAVIVGLSAASPWRAADLRFGDLVVAIDGATVTAPEIALDAIRDAGERLRVSFVRAGARQEVETPLTRRARETHEFYIPLLYEYESDRGKSDTSILLGLFRHEKTRAAWRVRLLWFIRFGRGDADALLEVDR